MSMTLRSHAFSSVSKTFKHPKISWDFTKLIKASFSPIFLWFFHFLRRNHRNPWPLRFVIGLLTPAGQAALEHWANGRAPPPPPHGKPPPPPPKETAARLRFRPFWGKRNIWRNEDTNITNYYHQSPGITRYLLSTTFNYFQTIDSYHWY